MILISYVWANLRYRRAHNLLSVVAITIAFTLDGLALGEAAGFSRAAAVRHVNIGVGFMLGAIAVSGIGMLLILFLTANAQAQSMRLRLSEFGLLKALGFPHRLILALATTEVAVPHFAGAMFGMIAAKLLFALLAALLPSLAMFPPPIYTPAILMAAVLLVLLMSGIGSGLLATRIVRLNPITALTNDLKFASPLQQKHVDTQCAPSEVVASGQYEPRSIMSVDRHLSRQVSVVTRVGLSTLRYRIKNALVIVVGVGALAFALLSFLSIAEGIRSAVLSSGDPSRAIIRDGHLSQAFRLEESKLPSGIAVVAAAAPGVAQARDGQKLVDPESFHTVDLIKRNSGEMGHTRLVGVGPHWRSMTPSFRLKSGRLPRAGTRELSAGYLAQRKFSGLDGETVVYQGQNWKIVGIFSTGDWWDGYLIGDAPVVKKAAKGSLDSLVRVRLSSPSAFTEFQHSVAGLLPASVIVERESDYYADFWRDIPSTVFIVGYLLGGLVAAGAIAATIQTMHGALESRAREIAVLRAIGFDGKAVAVSALIEAMLLATTGALIGSALVWLWLDGFLYNGADAVFRVVVDLHLLLLACGWGLTVALIGAMPAAIKAALQTPLNALGSV